MAAGRGSQRALNRPCNRLSWAASACEKAENLDRGAPLGSVAIYGNPDGNSLRGAHRPIVGEVQPAVTSRGMRFRCTPVLRPPDFHEQDRWTQFGSIKVTFRY